MLKQDTLENSKPSNPGKDCSSWIAIFLSPACNVQASYRLVTLWQKMQAYACVLAIVLVWRGHVSQHKILVTLSNGAFSQQLRAALQAGVFKLM
jgi:hypothetical protein